MQAAAAGEAHALRPVPRFRRLRWLLLATVFMLLLSVLTYTFNNKPVGWDGPGRVRRVAIVFRGHHTREAGSGGVKGAHKAAAGSTSFAFDFRQAVSCWEKTIFEPLRVAGYAHDVFAITYSSTAALEREMTEQLRLKTTVLLDAAAKYTQVMALAEGLSLLYPHLALYDRILILRFDLLLKTAITAWEMPFGGPVVWAPWREYSEAWAAEKRIGDAVWALDGGGEAVSTFIDVLKKHNKSPPAFGRSMHLIYEELEARIETRFIVDGFYDSNTALDERPQCKNPLYVMAARLYYHNDAMDNLGIEPAPKTHNKNWNPPALRQETR